MTSHIPLRTLSTIVRETFQLYERSFWTVIAIVAIAEGGLYLVSLTVTALLSEEQRASLAGVLGVLIVAVGGVVVWTLMTTAVMFAASEGLLQRSVGVRKAYATAVRRLAAVIGAELWVILALAALSLTVIGFPFAIYLGVRWDFIWQAAILEDHGPRASLGRSSTLVGGQWWRVVSILLVLIFLSSFIALLLTYTLGLVPMVGPVAAAILGTPVIIIAHTVLYHDLRVRIDAHPTDLA